MFLDYKTWLPGKPSVFASKSTVFLFFSFFGQGLTTQPRLALNSAILLPWSPGHGEECREKGPVLQTCSTVWDSF